MVTSPWKFLAGLTKRRVAKEEDSAPTDVATETSQVDEASIAALPEAPRASHAIDAKPEIAEPEIAEPAGRAEERPDSVVEKAVEELTTAADTLPVAVVKKSKVAASKTDEEKIPAASVAPAEDAVQSLDDDIRQLRLQLTQKLRLQNEQLKTMLARFNDR